MTQSSLRAPHCVVLVGGSAGSIEVLRVLLAKLPPDYRGAVLIVVHLGESAPGAMPLVLGRDARLPVRMPKDGEAIAAGQVYIAPPDRHLLVEDGHLRLSLGPKENRFRPSIDPLFRSAALAYGPRVIGVILSGLLDDGTLGLIRIKQFGGTTVVQDPHDAEHPSMPESALRYVDVDHVVPAADMPDLLLRLTDECARREGPHEGEAMAEKQNREAEAKQDLEAAEHGDEALARGGLPGTPSGLTCPECGGAVWETDEGKVLAYRCHVGHRFTAESMAADQAEDLEQTLWAAMRMFQEHASLHRQMAIKAEAGGMPDAAARFRERAEEAQRRTEVIRKLLVA